MKIPTFYLFLSVLLLFPLGGKAQNTDQSIVFRSLPSYINIPTEVQQIYQDRAGFIWFATRNGLCRYDGYELEIIKSNLYMPGILSSNDILAICEDYRDRLWIGSTYGLNVLDKRTGNVEKNFGEMNNQRIQSILVTSDSTIWIGTGSGLYKNRKEPDVTATEMFERVRQMDVKSLIEGPGSQIWIGTWSNGLFRYDASSDSLISYPAFNPLNSAYYLFQDSREQIWIGTWRYGLYRLCNPYNMEEAYFEKFVHEPGNENSIIHNLIYSITEDETTNTLWMGTLDGLSCFDGQNFTNYTRTESSGGLPYNEVTTVFRDRDGTIWLGFLGGGVYRISPQNLQFNLHRPADSKRPHTWSNIQGLAVFRNDLWLGLGNHGFMILDRYSHSTSETEKNFNRSVLHSEKTFFSFLKPWDKDELWVGTFGEGIYIYRPDSKGNKITNLRPPQYPDQLFCMFEDKQRNIYLGSTQGLYILTPEGKQYRFGNLLTPASTFSHSIYAIAQDSLGNIWVGTDHSGIFRIQGNQVDENCTFVPYNIDNGRINSNEIQCIFVNKRGNILVGTDGGGLNLYNPLQDTFNSIHHKYNIPGDMICSMLEDEDQNLWAGSNVGLIKLNLNDSLAENKCRLYTTSDGLQDNKFSRGAACVTEDGEMFFGGHQGYNSFYPQKLVADNSQPEIVVTDIQVQNRSLRNGFTPEERLQITGYAPEYTHTLRLNYRQNDLACKLSMMNFKNPEKNEYAYYLDGLDNNWQYTSNRNHIVSYSNLGSGTYTLYVKGTNGNGKWSEVKKAFIVIISPPWWASIWAYLIYTVLLVAIMAYSIRLVKNRIKLRNAYRLKELEQTKQEELNRAKLQFFTNITHELLTPLTIISITLNEIKSFAPQKTDYYAIMDNNINRLKRLLQQILEFRKAESGNLKLKVSQGNIVSFIRDSVNNFLPLIKKKKMQIEISVEEDEIIGYFDPDKIDKILYNLLSNAFKYNREGKKIQVNIAYGESKNEIVISVSDNGEGISEEKLSELFSRFYEGDHRKYHTTGYGIGLSLTKDLVTLHHGKIEVESQVNQGTTFRVVLPIAESAFTEEEIDPTILPVPQEETTNITSSEGSGAIKENISIHEHNAEKKTLLLVEDNEDLLKVLTGSLSHEYCIVTALNGKEAIEELEKTKDIAIVISDVMMPVMNGIELCHYIKNQEELLHIPVILLTAKNSESDIIEGYEAGADDYITKPFQINLLLVKIRSLLKNKERVFKDYSNSIVFEMQKPDISSTDRIFLKQAVDCVYMHLDDATFDQQAFADAMKVSKSTLYRKLTTLSGSTPSAFISDIRLKTAYQIISDNPDIRIADVSYTVGYNDPKYFSSCFKKKFDLLPSDIINKLNLD